MRDALRRLAAWVISNGVDEPGSYRACRDLLLRLPPRLIAASHSATLVDATEDSVEAAMRIVRSLDRSMLLVQGPPGAGKSTREHRSSSIRFDADIESESAQPRIGPSANSSPPYARLPRRRQRPFASSRSAMRRSPVLSRRCATLVRTRTLTKVSLRTKSTSSQARPGCSAVRSWRERWTSLSSMRQGRCPWPLPSESVPRLTISSCLAIRSSSPSRLAVSIRPERPSPHSSTSSPARKLWRRTRASSSRRHVGCTPTCAPSFRQPSTTGGSCRIQAASANASMAPGPRRDRSTTGDRRACRQQDVVSGGGLRHPRPRRRHAQLLLDGRGRPFASAATRPHPRGGALQPPCPQAARGSACRDRVGTVDKFQGQKAPVAIYAMATSSAEDVPRNLEFLFSRNRLNVAVSRARALAITVCSPLLLQAGCRTPEQLRLVSALCRFAAMATAIGRRRIPKGMGESSALRRCSTCIPDQPMRLSSDWARAGAQLRRIDFGSASRIARIRSWDRAASVGGLQ